jgi:hypothetical protein
MSNYNQQLDEILPQALGFFVANLLRQHQDNPEYFQEDPTDLLLIEDTDEVFEFIMNHDYWLPRWSNFLMKMLVDQIFKSEGFSFSLN